MKPGNSSGGFTLIEVMVVVAIIAILAAIGYPSYIEQVARSRRADAKAVLLERAQWMERQMSISGSYLKLANGNVLNLAAVPALPASTSPYYTMAFAANQPTASTFTLQLEPRGAMANDRCGTLTVTHTGTRTATGTAGYSYCWEK